ncbi:hypothetical protein SAMN05877809_103181 [Rhodobacter sp. JA431]|uniref:hypothetical protein n=1 Tax=Rhodobacter sp. JA431 TaxID=570013 RepID=UPI000BDCEC52|nr:hypothetical protein [Rhodobacter sp. JA431]SOC04350.1 hypothetical protein SAMN05877809_103181 [Rhodobacter sp. JA431]
MKIAPLAPPLPKPATTDLLLRPVLGRAGTGCPLLVGVLPETEILDLAPQVTPVPGQIAVCRDLPGKVVVLGYVGAAAVRAVAQAQTSPSDDGWLEIGTGKAQIRLHPDGRVRIKAEDVTLDSAGRLALRGAFIDLN